MRLNIEADAKAREADFLNSYSGAIDQKEVRKRSERGQKEVRNRPSVGYIFGRP